jgi:hypothetical protein
MAQHFTDFSEYTLGEIPADWPVEWGLIERAIVAGNPEAGSGQSLFLEHQGSSFSRNAVSWGVPVDAAVMSVSTRFISDYKASTVDDGIVSPVLCGRGTQSTRSGYYVFIRGSGALDLRRANNGSISTVASVSTFIPELLQVDLSVDFSINAVGEIKAYIWLTGDSKPTTPTLSYTDASPLPAGWAGFLDLSNVNHDGTNLYYFGVGTDGDPAPTTPVSANPNTPINLGATNILANSVRFTWEQG